MKNNNIGLIHLESKRDLNNIEDLEYYYWQFFDTTRFEMHILGNNKLLRTVLSRSRSQDIYPADLLYQLELNRRLIDIAWLYLDCRNYETNRTDDDEFIQREQDNQSEYLYQLPSNYYYDTFSNLHIVNNRKDWDPFKKENDYKSKIERFSGKVIWLDMDEIDYPHILYERIFGYKTFKEWIEMMNIWSEYTLMDRSICERLDGAEVYDIYVLFQKLTEMAYIFHNYGIKKSVKSYKE